jgi:HD-GYP domain-containing protein (c-di-GMP phosphodiesterase class II)
MTMTYEQEESIGIPRPMTLGMDIKDLDGSLLAEKGAIFSNEFLNHFQSFNPTPKPFIAINTISSLQRDLKQTFNDLPYSHIFQAKPVKDRLQKVMGETRLCPFVIEALNYFQEKDPYTYWHSLHVFLLTSHMALELIGPREGKIKIASLGPLHDIGKVAIPLETLQKKTYLNWEELRCIKHHVFAGAVFLYYHQGSREPLGPKVALEHHERVDGSGYPFSFPLANRTVEMIAICDVYDALISPRPYRSRAFDPRAALELLTEMALGGIFSLDLLRFMIAIHRREKGDYQSLSISLEKRGIPPEKSCYGQVRS